MRDKLLMVGGLCLFATIGVLAFFFTGVLLNLFLWISNHGSKWLLIASALYVPFGLFVLLPLAAFRGTRVFACGGMHFGKGLFGLTFWLLCVALTFAKWGKAATLVGLFFFGLGVLPMGVLAGFLMKPWYGGFITLGLVALYFAAAAAAHHFEES
jgi:hypothetical protein